MITRLSISKPSVRWIAIVALLFTLFQVSWSFRAHRLAQEPDTDDNEYLLDAIHRLDVLDQHGPIPFVQNLFSDPPHSPFATTVCLLGLAFGINGFAGPYVVNGFLVFIFLLEINRLVGNLSGTTRAILLAGVLLIPLTRLMVVELRPDFALGLFGAMACLRLCHMGLGPDRPSFAQVVFCAVLQAGTLLAKPTYFPHSFAIFGLSIGLSLLFRMVIDRRDKQVRIWKNLLDRAGPCLLSVAGCILLVLPYYIYGFKDIWDYILSNVWGSNAQFWLIPGGIGDSFQYFLYGPGIGPIGNYLQLFILTILAGIVSLFFLRRPDNALEILAGLMVALASAAVVILVRIGNPTFNVPSYFLLTLAAMTAFRYVFMTGRVRGVQMVAVLPILALGLIQPPLQGYLDRDRLAGTGIATKIVSTIESIDSGAPDFTTRPRKLVLAGGGGPLTGFIFEILAHQRHFPLNAVDLSDWPLDANTVMAHLGNPDFVCVAEPEASPPIFHDLEVDLLARFKSDRRFRCVQRFPLAQGGLWLFQRDKTVSDSGLATGGQ